MDLAAVIISTISLISSIACLVIMLATNYFSTHVVQMQPVNPMAGIMDQFSQEIGKAMGSPYREIDDPLDDQEREYLEAIKGKKQPGPPPKPVT